MGAHWSAVAGDVFAGRCPDWSDLTAVAVDSDVDEFESLMDDAQWSDPGDALRSAGQETDNHRCEVAFRVLTGAPAVPFEERAEATPAGCRPDAPCGDCEHCEASMVAAFNADDLPAYDAAAGGTDVPF